MQKKSIDDHIMDHHMVVGAEGARHHVVRGGQRSPPPPTPHPHYVVTYCFFGIDLR